MHYNIAYLGETVTTTKTMIILFLYAVRYYTQFVPRITLQKRKTKKNLKVFDIVIIIAAGAVVACSVVTAMITLASLP